MIKKVFCLAAALGLTAICSAETAVVSKKSKLLLTKEYIAIDSEKPMEFSVSVSGGKGTVNIYLFQYTRNKKKLGACHLFTCPGTETELTAAIPRGSKTFLVKDASKWNIKAGNIVAFNAKPDLSDLPNFNIEYYVRKVTKQDDGYVIEMSRPLRAYPAGTLVRLHKDAGNLGWGAKLPVKNDKFVRLQLPAPAKDIKSGHWWKGAAFVRVAVQTSSDTPVTVKDWSFKAVSPEKLSKRPAKAVKKVQKTQKVQKKKSVLSAYGFGKILKNTDDEQVFTSTGFSYAGRMYHYSGVSRNNISIPAEKVSQIEFDFKARTPGYLQIITRLELDGKKIACTADSQSVIPDGQYRRFIFNPDASRMWNKKARLTHWNIKFHSFHEVGRETGVRNVVIKDHKNLIPGAESLKAGAETPVTALRPNGLYRLRWQNGKCPGAEIAFYDHQLRVIPGTTLKVAPGTQELCFKAPEEVVLTKFKLLDSGAVPVMTVQKIRGRYTPELFWRGKWIWSRKTYGPDYANIWFTRDFEIDGTPEAVALALMADDVATIYVNGQKVGQAWPYSRPFRYDLMKYVKPGRNNITVMVYNLDTAGGFCADLYTKTEKGGKWLSTDSSWLCKETGSSQKWPEKFDQHAVELGLPEITPPWAGRVKFAYCGPQGKFHLLSSINGEFTARISEPVVSEYRTLQFERRLRSGKSTFFTLPIKRQDNADGSVTIRYPALQPANEDSQIFLKDDFWRTANDKPLAEIKGAAAPCKGFRQAEFINHGKRTMIRFNGQSYDPTFFMTSEWERMAAATDAGFKNFLVPARFTDFWKAEGVYDFSEFDKQAEILTTVVPDAVFMLDIRFFMPEWWLKKNPDDTSAYFEKTRRNTYDDVQALGSKNWLAAAEAPLRALLKHIENGPYAHRIWGVNIGDSRGNEWFWGGARAGADFYGKPAQPGYSPSEVKAFRNMLRRIYKSDEALAKAWNMPGVTIDKAEMPDHKIRRKGDVGSLFDSTKNRRFMDWCLFRNTALAEAINHFAGRIKALTDRKLLVGAYYGYMTELASNPNRSQLITGHNGFMLCLQSPDVDFFRAPSRYTYRKTGMSNGIMQTHSSFTLRKGKVVYIEHDERNAYGPSEREAVDIYVGRASTALESTGHFNREFGMFATQGIAQYWLDHARGSLYEPALVNILGEHAKVYRDLPPVRDLVKTQIAVVGDIDSIYYSIDGTDGIFTSAYHGLFRRINHLAAPFFNVVIHDLLEKDLLAPQKLYIMLPTLSLDARTRKALMQRFAREKATVLWLYSAGSSYPDKGLDVKFCGDFLGMKFEMSKEKKSETLDFAGVSHTENFKNFPRFYPISGYDRILAKNKDGKAILTVKKIDGATHIFSVLTDLSLEQLAAVADMAGVFRYSRNLSDPMWIGNDLLFVHSGSTGAKRIQLPSGVQMRAIIGPVRGVFKSGEPWQMEPGTTCGFLLEKVR